MKPFANAPKLRLVRGKTIHITGDDIEDGAVLIQVTGQTKQHWVPKKFLEDWPDKGKHGDIIIQEWIAKEKGIIK